MYCDWHFVQVTRYTRLWVLQTDQADFAASTLKLFSRYSIIFQNSFTIFSLETYSYSSSSPSSYSSLSLRTLEQIVKTWTFSLKRFSWWSDISILRIFRKITIKIPMTATAPKTAPTMIGQVGEVSAGSESGHRVDNKPQWMLRGCDLRRRRWCPQARSAATAACSTTPPWCRASSQSLHQHWVIRRTK